MLEPHEYEMIDHSLKKKGLTWDDWAQFVFESIAASKAKALEQSKAGEHSVWKMQAKAKRT